MCKVQQTDQELVSLYLKGTESALQELILRHERYLPVFIYW